MQYGQAANNAAAGPGPSTQVNFKKNHLCTHCGKGGHTIDKYVFAKGQVTRKKAKNGECAPRHCLTGLQGTGSTAVRTLELDGWFSSLRLLVLAVCGPFAPFVQQCVDKGVLLDFSSVHVENWISSPSCKRKLESLQTG